MNGIWLTISALTLSIFLVVIFFLQRHEKNKEVNIYRNLLLINLAFTINAVLIYLLYKITNNSYVLIFLEKIHLIIFNIIAYFLLKYILVITNIKEKILDTISKINLIYITSITILIIILPLNNSEILNITGPSYFVGMLSVIFYYALYFVITLKLYKDNNHQIKKIIPLAILIIAFIIDLVLKIYFKTVITETYCVTFSLLIMYFTIENPDTKLIEEIISEKDAAIKANHAKTEFITHISHEIRTPLNCILGFAESILDEEDLPSAQEDAKDIIDSSENLLEIVNCISEISKLETNRLKINNRTYNLKEEVENLLIKTNEKIGEKDIELSLYISKDVPKYLYGDKAKIKEIITNLLENALTYTERGFIKLTINCLNRDGYTSLIVSVEDSGRGIKPDQLNQIFELDYNVELGLTLSITKKLIELLGGNIDAQSIYGTGTKFTFYLKQRIGHEPENLDLPNKASSTLTFPNKKILLVDDDELSLKVAVKLLSKYGLSIDTCTSGIECIDLLNCDNSYDLILMDDLMPIQNGIETIHIIHDKQIYNNKIVVLTANATPGSHDKYISFGFDDYLSKPINQKELERVLDRFLGDNMDHIAFEPLPDSIYEISDTIILKMNQDKNPEGTIDELTPDSDSQDNENKKEHIQN